MHRDVQGKDVRREKIRTFVFRHENSFIILSTSLTVMLCDFVGLEFVLNHTVQVNVLNNLDFNTERLEDKSWQLDFNFVNLKMFYSSKQLLESEESWRPKI